MKFNQLAIAGAVLCSLLVGVWIRPNPNARLVDSPSWEQPTMGTLAHITLSGHISQKEFHRIRTEVSDTLSELNHTLSTWQKNSELSQFNRLQSAEPFEISPDLATVISNALHISQITRGAFDPTVKPLIDYWGFGPEQSTQSLEALRESVGWNKLQLVGARRVQKECAALQLDLSAIAKGYGVDRVAKVLQRHRPRFLVEIGGEIIARGTNPLGQPWRVGIERPESECAFGEAIFRTIDLSECALATSGDYRNFRARGDGTRYSHLIDPRTGQPAQSDIAAVSVLAPTCMEADAVATALFVMGSDAAIRWLDEHPRFEAFLILHRPQSRDFIAHATAGFPPPRPH